MKEQIKILLNEHKEILEGYTFEDFWLEEETDEENVVYIIEQLLNKIAKEEARNVNLEDTIESKDNELNNYQLNIYDEDVIHLPIHGLTVNLAYEGATDTGRADMDKTLHKTEEYYKWMARWKTDAEPYIPTYDELLEYGVDLSKPVFVHIGYICRSKFDIMNMDKVLIDEFYNVVTRRLKEEGRYELARRVTDNKINEAVITRLRSCTYYYNIYGDLSVNNNAGHCFLKFKNI